jgi:Predicted membrane protein (DUF2306)
MPPTLALHIKRVVLQKRSIRSSQEGSTSMIKIIRRPLGVVIGFLMYPTIVALHVTLGGLYLAPFQFVRRIRFRHLGYHRWAGRVLVSIGLVVGATGVFMGLVIPIAGWIERGVH